MAEDVNDIELRRIEFLLAHCGKWIRPLMRDELYGHPRATDYWLACELEAGHGGQCLGLALFYRKEHELSQGAKPVGEGK